MVVFGGKSSSDFFNAYIYKCNSWIQPSETVEFVTNTNNFENVKIVSLEIDASMFMNEFYIIGGLDSTLTISKMSIPVDMCEIFCCSKFICRQQLGCSYGKISSYNNTKLTQSYCFSSDQKEFLKNEIASSFNYGRQCGSDLLSQRNCSSFDRCDECQAKWPNEEESSCSWSKKCVASSNQTKTVDQCSKENCFAIDCEACRTKVGCTWAETGSIFQCVPGENSDQNDLCAPKCSSFFECSTCLSSSASEGGFNECVWSVKKGCFSPAYKAVLCTGGLCGLVLSKNTSDYCPIKDCNNHTVCKNCLKNVQCGWCSIGDDSGDGVCVEGNLENPEDKDGRKLLEVCDKTFETLKNVTVHSDFIWNFLTCPEENECLNQHHSCNNVSEKCIDASIGFECQCADGYEANDNEGCLPICPLGCVHGRCFEPGKCQCDFGYVGSNCSIQCLCSGHSNCLGPDKLTDCVECMNHTIGKQCEKCDKFFVGDPKNNVKCRSCLEYCFGHTDACVDEESSEKLKNLTKPELDLILNEGARNTAICLNCRNNTAGHQCETCNEGYFRGTSNLNEKCRKCECNGHGEKCDSVTGEKCDCANNTESGEFFLLN